MARPTARRSALRSESHMRTALTPSDSRSRTVSFSARIGAAPGSTPAEGRSMLLGILVAALGRLLRGPFAGRPVLAGEPAAEIDGAAARGAERERGVLLAWLHLRATGGTAAHAVVVGKDDPDFKRVARDDRASERLTPTREIFIPVENGAIAGRGAAGARGRRRPGHPPDARPVPVQRGVPGADGRQRQGGARHPRPRAPQRHPARPDDARHGRLAVRRRARAPRLARRAAAHPQRRPVRAGPREAAARERAPGEAVRPGRAARQGAAAHGWRAGELSRPHGEAAVQRTLIQPIPPPPSRATTHIEPLPTPAVNLAIPFAGCGCPGNGSSASSRSKSMGTVAKNE